MRNTRSIRTKRQNMVRYPFLREAEAMLGTLDRQVERAIEMIDKRAITPEEAGMVERALERKKVAQ